MSGGFLGTRYITPQQKLAVILNGGTIPNYNAFFHIYFLPSLLISFVVYHYIFVLIMALLSSISIVYYCSVVRPKQRANKGQYMKVESLSECPTPETVMLTISSAVSKVTFDLEEQTKLAVKGD